MTSLVNQNLSSWDLHPCTQNHSLLIQLILKEVAKIQPFFIYLKSLNDLCKITITEVQELLSCSIKFISEKSEHTYEESNLIKLKVYCESLIKSPSLLSKFHQLFAQSILQIFFKTHELLYYLKTLGLLTLSNRKTNGLLKKIQNKINFLLKIFSKSHHYFFQCLKKYSQNEKVIFFLLRKKSSLTTIFGSDLTKTLFVFFSKKCSLADFLIKQFQARGFDHLLPTIKREIFFHDPIFIA